MNEKDYKNTFSTTQRHSTRKKEHVIVMLSYLINIYSNILDVFDGHDHHNIYTTALLPRRLSVPILVV